MPDDDEDRSRFQRISDIVFNVDDDSDDSDEESDCSPTGRSWSVATSDSTPLRVSDESDEPTYSMDFSDYSISAEDLSDVANSLESTSPRGYNLQPSDESSIMVRSSGGKYYSATKYGDLVEGRKLKNMEENTIEEWFFNEATEHMQRRQVGEAFAGETYDATGNDGIKRAVIVRASEQIDERLSLGDNEVQAFNNVTDQWPREAQALLCSEELDQERNPDYLNDCRSFVEAYGMTDPDYAQARLDLFYDDNPFVDDDLSEVEADIVMLLRVNNEDEEGVLDRIGDYSSFINWYSEIGSVDQAIHAHEYDSALSTDQMENLAPPDEWPGDMDPGDVQQETCLNCTRNHFEVVAEGGEQTWMLPSGDLAGGEDVSGDEYLTDDRLICESCFESWQDNKVEVVIVGQRTTTKVEGTRMLRRVVEDGSWGDYGRINGPEESVSSAICRRNIPPDFSEISPDASFGNAQAQETAIRLLMDPDTEFENGTAYIATNDGPSTTGYSVYLPRDNAELAQEVKKAIDSNIN